MNDDEKLHEIHGIYLFVSHPEILNKKKIQKYKTSKVISKKIPCLQLFRLQLFICVVAALLFKKQITTSRYSDIRTAIF